MEWLFTMALVVAIVTIEILRAFTPAPRELVAVIDPDATHNGAAALAMALAVHGKNAAIEDIVVVVNDDLNTTNARRIQRTAKLFGLEGRGVRIDAPSDLARLSRGDILRSKQQTFVVFDHADDDTVTFADPSWGLVTAPRTKVWEALDGIAIAF